VSATTATASVNNDRVLITFPPKCRNRSATVARALRPLAVRWAQARGGWRAKHDRLPSVKGNPYPDPRHFSSSAPFNEPQLPYRRDGP